MSVKEMKLPVKSIKTNMVLARDVISDAGIVLMTENTMLNDRGIMKLKVYDIDYVFVKKSVEQTDVKDPIDVNEATPVPIKVRETPSFKAFEEKHKESQKETKEAFLSIGNGNGVDIPALHSITKSIMDSLRSKSDIFTYLTYLEKTDDHTYMHSINVSLLCNLFGYWLGYSQQEIINLTTAGMLHDIGKTTISLELLNKPGKLTKQEYEEIKKHTVNGYRLLEDANIDDNIKKATLMHHEKINGLGYPTGNKGNQINHFARIVAIADIYDAMTSDRSYRDKICPFDVLKTFDQECYGELDTQYLLLFLQNIAYTYVGAWVELSNKQIGEVVFINSNHLATPIVRIDNTFFDLTLRRDLTITKLL